MRRAASGDGGDRAQALAGLPDIPTLDEAGVPGYDVTVWAGSSRPPESPKP